jgi:lipid droplet-associated hydrolase-like protein
MVVQLLFRPPWPRVLSYLALLIRHIIPLFILRLLQPSWPENQLQVLHNLLRAPAAIYAALTMANDEMQTVRELDADFLRDFAHGLWFYYAEEDGWVGEQHAAVLRALRGTPAESHVVFGRAGIPHAFCISASINFLSPHRCLVKVLTYVFHTVDHSADVASQCVEWMRASGFLSG